MVNPSKILVVDDDKDDQVILLDVIKELYPSWQCSVACNGMEALDYIEKNPPPPAYVFLDLNMPLVDGFEFLKEFRKDKKNHGSIVVIYSTSTHPRDREITMDLGAADYIPKMGDLKKLKIKLKTVIDRFEA